ncbi:MAG: Ppx/GppA family phosphatase [Planctomycetes bacterium]|nr:Ppx/GppA family phosphatase [Planctomycetota bacterium]
MKLAAIDIGSNSVHMVIVETTPDGSFDVVDREKDMIKLGASTFRHGRLDDAAFAAGLHSIGKFRKLAERQGVDAILAVATSAVRDAENGPSFLSAVAAETGVAVRMISGEEEARLIALAVRDAFDLADTRALVIDVGGGSVEVVLADDAATHLVRSLRLGVQRLLSQVGHDGALPPRQRREIERLIAHRAEETMRQARDLGFGMVVGTSGTILTLAEVARLASGREPWPSPAGQVVSRAAIAAAAGRLCAMDAAQRAREAGVDARRADTIHLGAVVLATLLDLAGAEEITLCPSSLREGIIADFLERAGGAARPRDVITDLRRRSALDLARRCGQNGPRVDLIVRLALAIFDGVQALHGHQAADRRLLELAALLHDVGEHIAFERHEQHSYYIIRNADLRGFGEEEIEVLALAARYHRKARPKRRDRTYAALPPQVRRLVQLIAGIIRVADGLDRTRSQVVDAVRCEVLPDRVRLVAHATGDAELEIWAGRRKSDLLARVLGRPVEVALEAPHGEGFVEPRLAGHADCRRGD